MNKTFKLVVVRHGQAYQNVPSFQSEESDFTFDEGKKMVDTDLTKKGQAQANLVGKRLKYTNFSLAITSDMKRTVQTAETIINQNTSINKLSFWKVVRERYMGDLEGNFGLVFPVIKMEYSKFHDRDNQVFRTPEGESIADVRCRVREFIQEILRNVTELQNDSPTILVVTHGLFMFELRSVISDSEYGQEIEKWNPWHQNTGMTEYSFSCSLDDNNLLTIEKVECPILSCANHLDYLDDKFVSCFGRCHISAQSADNFTQQQAPKIKKIKSFTLTIVRHGQAFQNTPGYSKKEEDIKFEYLSLDSSLSSPKMIWNSDLTQNGLKQATLVAERFKDQKFDLAISSDMKRATQTAEAILKKSCSINKFVHWTVVRERYMGDIEFDRDLCKSLRPIDDAVCERDKKNKGPPNGESLVDLRNRVRQFLLDIQKEALKIASDSPTILVVSHDQFMYELYSVVSSSEYGKSLTAENVRYQNTGIASYSFTSSYYDNEMPILESAECSILSCASHLKTHYKSYEGCNGGCHVQVEEDNKKE